MKSFKYAFLASVIFISSVNPLLANKAVDGVKKTGEVTATGAKKVGSATVGGVKKVGSATATGAKKASSATVGGVKKVGSATATGAKKVGTVAANGAKKVIPGSKEGIASDAAEISDDNASIDDN